MNRKNFVLLLIVAASLVFGLAAQNRTSQKWEYKESCSSRDMNKLGDEGWELVATTSNGAVQCLYYKRPKSEP
ncbi:MAG TPA: hypothetical protein VK619_12115 [Pyrinomonadaceae bacterium]|nr:hypothetical protein [Pyrinomonadaceae bacterium]